MKTYRHNSVRLPDWDYSGNGKYLITLVTKGREHLFEKIKQEKMDLSKIGKTAQHYWNEIPIHFPGVLLDQLIIMSSISPKKGSLSVVIRSYTSAVTKKCHEINPYFFWQPGCYEHIINDDQEYYRFRQYIWNNPINFNWDNNILQDGF